jgi:hypothetical protein
MEGLDEFMSLANSAVYEEDKREKLRITSSWA